MPDDGAPLGLSALLSQALVAFTIETGNEAEHQMAHKTSGYGAGDDLPLFAALAPYPDGWRAKVPLPATLPHYPMLLHRGGYPDGS